MCPAPPDQYASDVKMVPVYMTEFASNAITRLVSGLTGLSEEMLKGNQRQPHLVQARWLCWFLIHQHTRASYRDIARLFGQTDHSTVVKGLSSYRKRFAGLPEEASVIAALSLRLKELLDEQRNKYCGSSQQGVFTRPVAVASSRASGSAKSGQQSAGASDHSGRRQRRSSAVEASVAPSP